MKAKYKHHLALEFSYWCSVCENFEGITSPKPCKNMEVQVLQVNLHTLTM